MEEVHHQLINVGGITHSQPGINCFLTTTRTCTVIIHVYRWLIFTKYCGTRNHSCCNLIATKGIWRWPVYEPKWKCHKARWYTRRLLFFSCVAATYSEIKDMPYVLRHEADRWSFFFQGVDGIASTCMWYIYGTHYLMPWSWDDEMSGAPN